MRQIEKLMLRAVSDGNDFRRDNTDVSCWNHLNWNVKLHNTVIAQRKDNIVVLSSGGWKTNTTKSRLNAILSHFGKGRISQEKGVWYWYYSGRGECVEFVDGMQFEVVVK